MIRRKKKMPIQSGTDSISGIEARLNIGDNIRFSFVRRNRIVELTGYVHGETADALTIANYSPYKSVSALRDRIRRTYQKDKIIVQR